MDVERKIHAVILAAGKGTRMRGTKPKLLIEVEGKPIIARVVQACQIPEIEKIYLVVGSGAEMIKKAVGSGCEFVVQRKQLGTGHALIQTQRLLRNYRGDLVVLVGDSPFLTSRLVRRLIKRHQKSGVAATFLTTKYADPPPYGRIIRDTAGKVVDVKEENQCTSEQKRIKEVITSHYCFRAEIVLPLLSEIRDENPKHEYYLTDIIPILNRHGYEVGTVDVKDPRSVFGINDARDLRWARGKS
jgi:bifunctional UDP-N-acetylglucosamine pyrophosphorylase/glucosamine-1-phosphate N-acetyltransferase